MFLLLEPPRIASDRSSLVGAAAPVAALDVSSGLITFFFFLEDEDFFFSPVVEDEDFFFFFFIGSSEAVCVVDEDGFVR